MVAALLLSASLGIAAPRAVHPLHTTMAEVTIDRPRGTLRVVVRVFADDFGTAVNGTKATGPWDARAAAYVAASISILDERHQRLALHDCGTRRQGDLLWLCAETAIATSRGISFRDQMLCELFADQVNVVRVTDAAATRSMLFTRGDPAKTISD